MTPHLKFCWLFLLAACGGDPLLERVAARSVTSGELRMHTVYALPPFTDAPMPVYLVVVNQGTLADTLVAASSPSSASVMVHGGGMEMLHALPVPAGDELELAPGGLHLMLAPPLDRRHVRGDSVSVTLRFALSGDVTLWAFVIDYAEVDAVRR